MLILPFVFFVEVAFLLHLNFGVELMHVNEHLSSPMRLPPSRSRGVTHAMQVSDARKICSIENSKPTFLKVIYPS